jgi:Mn-dependent DtxR family transcriptional regulator
MLRSDEIADELRIDLVLVNEILKELAEKGVVE